MIFKPYVICKKCGKWIDDGTADGLCFECSDKSDLKTNDKKSESEGQSNE